VAISNPQRGNFAPKRNVIPRRVAKPRQLPIEGNRAAVADGRRSYTYDEAAHYTPAHRGLPILRLKLKFHRRSRQQPTIGLH